VLLKNSFFKFYFTKLFSIVKSAVTVFAALIVIIKEPGFTITSKNWKHFESNTYSFLIPVGMMMIYTGSSNVISRL